MRDIALYTENTRHFSFYIWLFLYIYIFGKKLSGEKLPLEAIDLYINVFSLNNLFHVKTIFFVSKLIICTADV